MSPTLSLYTYLVLVGLVQFLLVSFAIYRLFIRKRMAEGREWVMLSFALYWFHLIFFIGESSMRAGIVHLINPDVLGVFHHLFYALFLVAFGYGLVSLLATRSISKRIAKHSAYLVVFVITLISLVLVLEGQELRFSHTDKEFIYETLEAMITSLIIVILFNSWSETGSRRLFLDVVAFSLFLVGNAGHILTLMGTHRFAFHLEFTLLRYIFSTFAFLILSQLLDRTNFTAVGRSTPN